MRLLSQLNKIGEVRLTASQFVLLILVLVSTITVLFLLIRVQDLLDRSADKSCAAQIQQANLKNQWLGRETALELDKCKTRYVSIATDDQALLKRKIADEMAWCWYQWGEGDVNLFKLEGQYCYPCSILSFDKPIGQIPSFMQYLEDTKILSSQITYAEYLSTASRDTTEMPPTPEYSVDTNEQYAVLLWYSRQREDGIRKVIYQMTGWDITPSQIGIATGGSIAIGGEVVMFFTLRRVAPVLRAFGPVGKVVRNTIIGGANTAITTTAVGVGAVAYVHARESEGWYTLSGIYLTPNKPDGYYAKGCSDAAVTSVSP
jgi:hypothetical protein